ncbi:acetate--CoA ligase family protein [Alphaproteobacteria bacterium KMM 3653]|uniref:Acetate--CoA ligase family protein n=1 Tax=Harenicola maris TaxID=2841044 RepID=A0AAP2CN56_9RHOB|nr:acetate--CoA ligase family protein [Harenicola maris]
MTRDLSRLLAPKSIAVIGGGWGESVIKQLLKAGYQGQIWPIHPAKRVLGGLDCYASLSALPAAPDAAFVAVNRSATVEVIGALAGMGAGGAICFASGFAEAEAEAEDGPALEAALIAAAGEMPILGPNCYGLINAMEAAPLWPDQHGCTPCSRGVAILAQSSNIALNLTMQARGVPLAFVGTLGNQAQTGMADMAATLLEDPRITAIGFYIEGFKDLRAWEAVAVKAQAKGIPLIALKSGKSEQARSASVSHTASLAGSAAGASALLARLGISEVDGLAGLLEALKIVHMGGWLGSNRIASMSCSGGEAGLMADSAWGLEFPPLNSAQQAGLRTALGPMVALANPLDYHTYIWGDRARMAATYSAMMQADLALGVLVLDLPKASTCDPAEWDVALEAVELAAKEVQVPMAVMSSLPETLPEPVAERLMDSGVIPLAGIRDAFEGIAGAIRPASYDPTPLLLPLGSGGEAIVLAEAEAKAALAGYGLRVPRSARASGAVEAGRLAAPMGKVVLKGEGVAHKSEAGAVVLGLSGAEAVEAAALAMPAGRFLVEEMVTDGLYEILIGITRDPAHGFVLTLGAGGVMTEVLADTAHLLVPAAPEAITGALQSLRIAPVLAGYRGKPGADTEAIVSAVMALQAYVIDHAERVEEVEVNPLICRSGDAIAADALIKVAL